jgi:ceramide glucosyltransferase
MNSLTPIGVALVIWAMAVFWTSLEAIRRTIWYARAVRRGKLPSKIGAKKPSVLVLRPCAGREPSLETTLTSLAKTRRSFEVRCRFAIESENDSAMTAARHAVETLERAGIPAEIVLTGGGGPNRKAAQLAAVTNDADVIIVADSDVDLEGIDLDVLVAPVVSEKPAWIAWAPPIECAEPRTWGDSASGAVLGASLHCFPILARLDPRSLVGKLFAIRKNALVTIGGFGSLVTYLGEDMETARRIREHGGTVVVVPLLARSLASGRSWSAIIARFARWMTVIRTQRPLLLWSYPGLFFATWPIVIVSLCYSRMDPICGFLAASLVLTTRLLIALFATYVSRRRIRLLGILRDAILADLVLASAFAHALRSRRVKWRDHVLVVDRSGILRESS